MDINFLKNIKKVPKYFKVRTFQNELKRLSLLEKIAGLKPPVVPRYVILFWASLFLTLLAVFFINKANIPRETVFMSGIFIFSALLWVTEALPLFATSLVIVALEIIFLSNPGGWSFLGFEVGNSPNYKEFLAPLSNPIIVLFFGGFLLAQATVKEGVDKVLASIILNFFGSKPKMILLGLMLITALFSMWISNTATAAMMIALSVPIIDQIEKTDPFRKGILLAIPFAANIGGIGTPIASPPNAVALGFLRKIGFDIKFIDWVLISLPILLLVLFISWYILLKIFPPNSQKIELNLEKKSIDKRGWFVIFIFLLTVSLWLTESLHGFPTSVVAMLPAVAFTTMGLLTRFDLNQLEWHILILIVGGLALGIGMELTGLDKLLVQLIPFNEEFFILIIVISTVIFSTLMSNTAASNLLIPIGVTSIMATTSEANVIIHIGFCIAISASMSMALPISTPPNTIAYAKGELDNKDFIFAGSLISVIASLIIIIISKPLVNFWL